MSDKEVETLCSVIQRKLAVRYIARYLGNNMHSTICTCLLLTKCFLYSELSSISNLLGRELLKVVNHQCEILEDDVAFIHFLQKGTGLYLLKALDILAEQVRFYM